MNTGLSDFGVDKVDSISWVAELVSSFGAHVTNEARLQIADERHPRVANSSIPELTISTPSQTFFNAGQIWYTPSQLNEFNNQILDTVTWSEGDWLVKGGVDMQWVPGPRTSSPGTWAVSFNFQTMRQPISGPQEHFRSPLEALPFLAFPTGGQSARQGVGLTIHRRFLLGSYRASTTGLWITA